MKKLSFLFAVLFSLAFVSPTLAAGPFGPDFARFHVTPEEGWTATAIDGGVQLVNATNESVLAISIVKDDKDTANMSAADFGKAVAQASGMTNVSVNPQDNTTCVVDGTKDGKNLRIIVVKEDGKACTFVLAGSEMDAMTKMINSIKDAQ